MASGTNNKFDKIAFGNFITMNRYKLGIIFIFMCFCPETHCHWNHKMFSNICQVLVDVCLASFETDWLLAWILCCLLKFSEIQFPAFAPVCVCFAVVHTHEIISGWSDKLNILHYHGFGWVIQSFNADFNKMRCLCAYSILYSMRQFNSIQYYGILLTQFPLQHTQKLS